jgi:hypothetical protein
MTESGPVHETIPVTDKELALKIKAYEEDLNQIVFGLVQYFMRPDGNLTYEDVQIGIDGFEALEDYQIVVKLLRPKCLDDAIYFMVLRDLVEIMDDISKYLIEGRTHLKDRINFRLWLFKRDVYTFIKDCPSFRS